jgi:hypothetical protein
MLMFQARQAIRLALDGVAAGVACGLPASPLCAPAAVGHSSGDTLGVRPLGALAGNFGRGTQCGVEHPFAPVDFLAHVQDQ